ncbi:hypothetical protein [Methylorubrum sp. SB2]|uniref:hypothetical protein n=1 Tax=Methylorubrum subtropicum TaxID=3138812 RepID=UPI00313F1C1E
MSPEEEVDLRFYTAIGRCITAWAHVEDELAAIYMEAIGAPNSAPAFASFYAVQSPEVKISITHSAVSMRLASGDVLSRWKSLYNRATKRRKTRNAIAHYQVMINPQAKRDKQYELRPMIRDLNNIAKYGPDPLRGYPVFTQHMIEAAERSLWALSRDLKMYAYVLGLFLGQRAREPALDQRLDPELLRLSALSATEIGLPPEWPRRSVPRLNDQA